MLTPIDEIANQNHLQLIKAAVAFLPPPSQRSLSLLIKLLELRNLSAFFQKQGSLHACNVASSASLPEMLAEMRNYCDGSELELIDQLGQVCSLMELYSVMMQPLTSLAGQAQGKSQNELLPFLMSAASGQLSFDPTEIDTIIRVLKIGKSPQETQRIDRMCALMKQFNRHK